jgi:nicotinate-nucleotide adenylyltransferase
MAREDSVRVGLFGGTFDPPHIGHIAVAAEARYQLGLDHVLLVVANDPWQKSAGGPITPAADRLEMVTAAVAGHPGLEASDVEIRRGGPSYSIDTVVELSPRYGDLTLIMGADTAAGLDSWHRSKELSGLVRVGVTGRIGSMPNLGSPWRVETFECPVLQVSSSDIRHRCHVGAPIDHLVPTGVGAIVESHALYGFRR